MEGHQFPANRSVLACESSFFEALLLGNFSEAHQNDVAVEDASPEAAVLRYLTLDELPSIDVQSQVYNLALKYGLEFLAEFCKEKVGSKQVYHEAQRLTRLHEEFIRMEAEQAADTVLPEVHKMILSRQTVGAGGHYAEFEYPLQVFMFQGSLCGQQ